MEEQLNGKIMTDDEAIEFVATIGRKELFNEFNEMRMSKKIFLLRGLWHDYPFYLKAIRVSLIQQGYDSDWVETKFREILEAAYLGHKPGQRNWERGTLTKIKNLRKQILRNSKWAERNTRMNTRALSIA